MSPIKIKALNLVDLERDDCFVSVQQFCNEIQWPSYQEIYNLIAYEKNQGKATFFKMGNDRRKMLVVNPKRLIECAKRKHRSAI